jgi:hypothetical protein
MGKLFALAAFVACFAVPCSSVQAATVQLDGESPFDGTGYIFHYGGTLAPTEGVTSGSKLVIFDFAGYIAGSIFSPYATISASVEPTTSDVILAPGITDDPALVNLVFTYTGPDFQTGPSGSTPYAPIDFSGLTAKSIFGGTVLDGFATTTVKNEGSGVGTTVFSTGNVAVPMLPIPEPGTWALMIVGLGVVGLSARRNKSTRVSYS